MRRIVIAIAVLLAAAPPRMIAQSSENDPQSFENDPHPPRMIRILRE
jgi:hypothetical protein